MYLTVSLVRFGDVARKRYWFWCRWPLKIEDGAFLVPQAYLFFYHEEVLAATGYRVFGVEVCVFRVREKWLRYGE